MKKFISLTLALILVVVLSACSGNTTDNISQNQQSSAQNENSSATSQNNLSNNKSSTAESSGVSIVNKEGASSVVRNVKIRLTFNNHEIVMDMHDNPTTRDLLKRLPLTLKFEDYSGAEKIGHLSNSLTTNGAPSGSDPSVGDIAFYAPWGNIVLYYHDVGYYDGIIPLGHTNPSEMKKLENMKGDFNVRIERVD